MKLAMLGGSFNPLHKGHMLMAEAVIKELGYDKVLFIPAGIPPHKRLNCDVSAEHRLKMVQLLCNEEGNGSFGVETCEIDRGGISYTVDTVNYLIDKYKLELEGKLGLIMGEENASEFHKWKNVDEIVSKCQIIIVPRKVSTADMDIALYTNDSTGNYKGDFKETFNPDSFPYEYMLLSNPVMAVSSTEIRAKLATDKNVQELMPSCVYKYIVDNNLYKA